MTHVRLLDPQSESEIALVAARMRQTLVDVMGEEKGGGMYTPEWIRDRLLWHLDPLKTTARVFVSENGDGAITGHAIARLERDDAGGEYGYFSTIFVEASSRRSGIATALLAEVERWFISQGMKLMVYNTAHWNAKLITMYEKHGFKITLRDGEMVRLEKIL